MINQTIRARDGSVRPERLASSTADKRMSTSITTAIHMLSQLQLKPAPGGVSPWRRLSDAVAD